MGTHIIQKVLFGWLILFGSFSCFAQTSDGWVIRDDGMGPVKLGMTLAQLKATFHQNLREDNDAASENCFYVHAKGHEHIRFMIEDGKLTRIDVDARGISTNSGLQVGDAEARVHQFYGTKVKVTPHKYVDTGRYLTVHFQDPRYGIRFETDKGKITEYYVGTYEAIQYVEGCL
jgi:hypothetical protein